MKASAIEEKYNVKAIKTIEDDCLECCFEKNRFISACKDCLDDYIYNKYIIFKEKAMKDRDFREGDKILVMDGGVHECVFKEHSTHIAGQCTVTNNETGNDFVTLCNCIYHDHDRKISAAVQKAIEENVSIPVRKVKKYINIIQKPSGKRRWDIYEFEIDAIERTECDYPEHWYVAIGLEIEIEEDKL